ncbi:MAG TPA: hypothetical protein VHP38_04905 [Ruminiclostridium sp.]|nr:hypothetical protein [Ruminiclostridium sp.]
MKNYQQKDEILYSWRRCIENNLPPNNPNPNIRLPDAELKTVLNNNKMLISTFEEAIEGIEGNIIGKCLFLYYQMLTKSF